MATMVKSMALEGIEGFPVEIEAATIRGQQQMVSIIGLGDQAVKEAGERIQAAITCYGYDLPKDKTLISLAPGNRRKRGSHYDLGMTLALLAETDQIAARDIEKYVFIGELSLDGRIRPCTGVLSMITAARQCGITKAVVPAANLKEAQKISGIEAFGLHTLEDAVRLLEGRGISSGITEQGEKDAGQRRDIPDFSEVRGQRDLLDAVILAAAGGHNLLMIGEPGCGKSMIAARIPGILPEMTEEEALEVTKIQSIAGNLKRTLQFIRERQDVISREIKLCGYFCIITSADMKAEAALDLYKSRDCSEKLFRGDKSYLGEKSMRVYQDEPVHSKIFIEFVALIVRNKIYTCLKDRMKELHKKKNYMTVPAALKELDKIELIRQADGVYRLDHAVTATQKDILLAFNLTAASVKKEAGELGKQLSALTN